MEKKVSVIIPTYKRPVFLSRAIDSVIKTKWGNLEIIVVDDNNEGDEYRKETEELMAKYLKKYPYIKYIKHRENKNGSVARNSGFRASTGDYIMFLDDDDEFFSNKIHAQVEFMEKRSAEWGACYTRYYDVDDRRVVAKGVENKEGDLLVDELARNLFVHAGSNLMVRRSVVEELNGFDESFLRNQDVEFLVRILKKYKLGFVDVLGLAVHVHPRKYIISYYELTKQYLEKFEPEIKALQPDAQNAIYRMIGLQLIRNALQNKDFTNAKFFKKQYGLRSFDIVKYFGHLLIRVITHKAYGYPMSNLYRG